MRKISDCVEEIIKGDTIAVEALRLQILNLSSYARSIQKEVETRTAKKVQMGSIVIALSRLQVDKNGIEELKPSVWIEDLGIKSPLCEISYEKTRETLNSAAKIRGAYLLNEHFFTVTQGVREISIICPQELKDAIKLSFNTKPKGEYDNLVAVTVRFKEEEYIEVPNMIFSLISSLATKRINLIEIVSTFTEISFIVRKNDMSQTIECLQQFFPKS